MKVTYKIEVINEDGNMSFVQSDNKTKYFDDINDAREVAAKMRKESNRCTYVVVDSRYGHKV